jgi:hypothetical protein
MLLKKILIIPAMCLFSVAAFSETWEVTVVNHSGQTIGVDPINDGSVSAKSPWILNGQSHKFQLTHSSGKYNYSIYIYGPINAYRQIGSYGTVKATGSFDSLMNDPYHRKMDIHSDPFSALEISGNTITVNNVGSI